MLRGIPSLKDVSIINWYRMPEREDEDEVWDESDEGESEMEIDAA